MRTAKPTSAFVVYARDDEGETILIDDARSACEAARRAAALDPSIDARSFATTWNAANADESVRYAIGEESVP
jgi:hypothetical protein